MCARAHMGISIQTALWCAVVGRKPLKTLMATHSALSPARQRRLHRDRQRRQRERERQGLVVLKIEADEHALAAALIAAGRISEADALDRKHLQATVSELLRAWAERHRA
jgi:DNA-binding GntR family transcriptional regulator